MFNSFLEICPGFHSPQLITKLSTQNLQNKNVLCHAMQYRGGVRPSHIIILAQTYTAG